MTADFYGDEPMNYGHLRKPVARVHANIMCGAAPACRSEPAAEETPPQFLSFNAGDL